LLRASFFIIGYPRAYTVASGAKELVPVMDQIGDEPSSDTMKEVV
jgi:hypothetical protein